MPKRLQNYYATKLRNNFAANKPNGRPSKPPFFLFVMDLKARIFYATCDALGEIGGHHGQTFHRSAAMFFMNRYLGAKSYGLVTPHTFKTATACRIALARVRERFAQKPYMVSDLCTANPLLFALEKHYIQNGRKPLAGFVPTF